MVFWLDHDIKITKSYQFIANPNNNCCSRGSWRCECFEHLSPEGESSCDGTETKNLGINLTVIGQVDL